MNTRGSQMNDGGFTFHANTLLAVGDETEI
jgi:hypothetical protein